MTTTTICWGHPRWDEQTRCWCRDFKAAKRHAYWGRCRSGKRWFWATTGWHCGKVSDEFWTAHGWADDEQAAIDAAHAAVVEFAGEEPTTARTSHGCATDRLKALNAEKRAARPPSDDTDAAPVEYLYALHHYVSDAGWIPDEWSVRSFRITKKTAKRVYYLGAGDRVRYVDRQALERDGEVRNRSRGWWDPEFHLYVSPPELPNRRQQQLVKSVSELRKEMANAHPDRGGDRESFETARRAYLGAKARTEVPA